MNRLPLYLASVALEPNRWAGGGRQLPSFEITSLATSLRAAGWDGIECWEFHYTMAAPEERARLATLTPAVKVFNSYWLPDQAPDPARMLAPVAALPTVEAVKFNFSGHRSTLPAQFDRVRDWLAALPGRVKLLCECHRGSPVETPEEARAWLDRDPDPRKGLILHPLALDEVQIKEWFSACPSEIRHLHLAWRDVAFGRWMSIAESPEHVRRRLALCFELGFRGSMAVEFVSGTGRPGESVQALLNQCRSDLASLRQLLSRVNQVPES